MPQAAILGRMSSFVLIGTLFPNYGGPETHTPLSLRGTTQAVMRRSLQSSGCFNLVGWRGSIWFALSPIGFTLDAVSLNKIKTLISPFARRLDTFELKSHV